MKRIVSAGIACLLVVLLFNATLPAQAATAKLREIYRPDTELVLPPVVVQTVTQTAQVTALADDETPPQAVWLPVAGGETPQVQLSQTALPLSQAFGACGQRVIPVLAVDDAATAESVLAYIASAGESDLFIASAKEDVLRQVAAAGQAYVYTVYLAGENADVAAVARAAHRCGAIVAALPSATAAQTAYLQRRFLTVWLNGEAEDDVKQVYAAVDAGADGVVVKDAHTAYEQYAAVTKPAYVRTPAVVGHRGFPRVAPENSLASMQEAFANGADAVECDIYLTADGHLAVLHNSNLAGYVEEEGPYPFIESMTRQQIEAYTLKTVGKHSGCKVPFLDELFAELRQWPDKLLVVEIKSSQAAIVQRLRDLAEQYGVIDRIVVISFSQQQIQTCRAVIPEIGVSWLSQDIFTDTAGLSTTRTNVAIRKCLQTVVPLAASISPYYAYMTAEMEQKLHARGVSVNVWTVDAAVDISQQIAVGAMFITTNRTDRAVQAVQALPGLSADAVWGPQVARGDVNADGRVDAVDALQVLKMAVGKLTPDALTAARADLNADGDTDARDALLVLKIAVGKAD